MRVTGVGVSSDGDEGGREWLQSPLGDFLAMNRGWHVTVDGLRGA